jgi:hypothetical protein
MILADDMGYNDVGFHNPNIKTPNIGETQYALVFSWTLKKAFDVCSHEILLIKLKKYMVLMVLSTNGWVAT